MSNEKLISDLISEVLAQMKCENHSFATIADYRRIYDKFGVFCRDIQEIHFTYNSGRMFLESVELQHPEYDHGRRMLYERAIRRLKCALEGVAWKPMYHPNQEIPSSCFDEILEQYSYYLMQHRGTTEYRRTQLHNVSRFFCRLEKHGVKQMERMTAGHIYDIFSDWEYSVRTRRDICAFLKYAYIYKLIPVNLTVMVPTAKRHYAIPSVYTPEEVEKMLASVDRDTKIGKRNYAILLLAARLGLRASDIAALTFDSLKSETIEFVQAKTKRKQSLVFLPEVKTTIYDYVSNGRPQSTLQEIFLDKGGYDAISARNIGGIARAAFAKAEVNCKNRRSGSHALRASLATALLAEGNSYFVIQKLLDHVDVQTSKSYAKADVAQLRICALPVPEPTGNFKSLLKPRNPV